MTESVWKLVHRTDWESAVDTYGGSPNDLADGYIHMSTADQLAQTAARHYRGCTDLLLIEVALQDLTSDLVWEPSRGGALFPHLYRPLPLSAVRSIRPLSVDAVGEMRFADGAAEWS